MEMKRPIGIGRLLVSFVLAASLCLATIPGQADIYRWQDEEGNWHFSDSPTSEAPIEQPPILTQTNPRPDKHPYTPESPAAGSLLPGMSPASPKEAPPPSSAPSDTASIQGGLLWRIDSAGAGESYLLGTIQQFGPPCGATQTECFSSTGPIRTVYHGDGDGYLRPDGLRGQHDAD